MISVVFLSSILSAQESGWQVVGTEIDAEDDSHFGSATISGNGNVVVSYIRGSGVGYAYVKDGSEQWVKRGLDNLMISENSYSSRDVLALNHDGSVVAYKDGNNMITVEKWLEERNYWMQLGNDVKNDSDADLWGSCISLNKEGNLFVIGDYKYLDENDKQVGRIIVYKLSDDETTWEKVFENKGYLTKYEKFADGAGLAVDMTPDGKYIIYGHERGKITVLEQDGTTYKFRHSIEARKYGQSYNFGRSVAISDNGSRILVGASYYQGYVQAYQWDGAENKYIELGGKIVEGNSIFDNTGFNVDMNGAGDIIAVSSWKDDNNEFIKTYNYTEEKGWQKFGIIQEECDYMGYCVKLDQSGKNLIYCKQTGDKQFVKVMNFKGDISTSVKNPLFEDKSIALYPSPAKSYFNFKSTVAGTLQVYNMAGLLMTTEKLEAKEVGTYSTYKYTKGIYIAKFTDISGNVQTTKFHVAK